MTRTQNLRRHRSFHSLEFGLLNNMDCVQANQKLVLNNEYYFLIG